MHSMAWFRNGNGKPPKLQGNQFFSLLLDKCVISAFWATLEQQWPLLVRHSMWRKHKSWLFKITNPSHPRQFVILHTYVLIRVVLACLPFCLWRRQRMTATSLFSLRLCLLMSLKTAKLKVPLLAPEGNQSAFDSLTALISVLDTNSSPDAPSQSLVRLERCLTGHWQVALLHYVSWLTA